MNFDKKLSRTQNFLWKFYERLDRISGKKLKTLFSDKYLRENSIFLANIQAIYIVGKALESL